MAPPVSINYLAVLVTAVISMVIGFLWYGPLFGKVWMQLMKIDKKKMEEAKKKGMAKSYIIMFIGLIIMNYILAHFVSYAQAKTAVEGMQLGFWIWLGFIATVMLSSVLWEGRPVKLYLINVAHYLVALLVSGAILAVWV